MAADNAKGGSMRPPPGVVGLNTANTVDAFESFNSIQILPSFSKEHSCAVDFIELNYSCKKGKSRPDFTNLSVPIQKIYQRRNKLNKY